MIKSIANNVLRGSPLTTIQGFVSPMTHVTKDYVKHVNKKLVKHVIQANFLKVKQINAKTARLTVSNALKQENAKNVPQGIL